MYSPLVVYLKKFSPFFTPHTLYEFQMHRQAFIYFYDDKKMDHSVEFRSFNENDKCYIEGTDDYFQALQHFCNACPDTLELSHV